MDVAASEIGLEDRHETLGARQKHGLRSRLSSDDGVRPRPSGKGSIWVLTQEDGTVQRIDGQTGKVTATIETGVGRLYTGTGDIATCGGYVCRPALRYSR
jgi:hypothetical protein